MAGETFDDYEDDGIDTTVKSKPLWTVKVIGDNDDTLKWMQDDFALKEQQSFRRNMTYRENLCMFKGIQYKSNDPREVQFQEKTQGRTPKIVINHIYDWVETRVSKLTRFRPAISVIPANDEHADKINARTIKDLIDTRWYDFDIDEALNELELMTDIYGEGFMFPEWNPYIGHEFNAAKRLEAGDDREVGKPTTITNEDGDTITIPANMKVGDVDYRLVTPDRILPQKRKSWKKVEHLTEVEYWDIEELKAKYPDKQHDIKLNNTRLYDLTGIDGNLNGSENEVLVMRLYHKKTREMPKGKLIIATHDTILEVKDQEIDVDELPCIRQTDIDVSGELHARSVISLLKQIQRHFNNLASGVARNHGLASLPKWVMPKGACDIKQLGNTSTVITFKGPVAPRLEQYNPTAPEVFLYMDKLEGYGQKLSGTHGISRGEPPKGVTAAVAMQFLDEQETERANRRIGKRNSVIIKTAKFTAAIMGKHYKPSDERFMKIAGKGNEFKIRPWLEADFSKPYDMRIQKSSALSESRAQRTQNVIDLGGAFPNVFKDEMVIDLLDLSQDQKFRDMATVAVRAAEFENEELSNGEQIEEAKEWEDQVIHYRIHLIDIQDISFKSLPKEIQLAKKEHIKTHEYLMWTKAQQNPAFAEQLLIFPMFPIFFDAGDPELEDQTTGPGDTGIEPAPMPEGQPATPQEQQPAPLPVGEDLNQGA